MSQLSIKQIILSDDERNRFAQTIPTDLSADETLEEYLSEVYFAGAALPQPVRHDIFMFKRASDGAAALHIKNLPQDASLPPTPTTEQGTFCGELVASKACLLGIGQMFGEPYGYAKERDGELMPGLYPIEAHAKKAAGTGSGNILGMHNDIAHDYPNYPSYTLLYCLRPDPTKLAKTLLANMDEIRAKLSKNEVELLFEPVYKITVPDSFRAKNDTNDAAEPRTISVLHGSPMAPEVTLQFNTMSAITPDAQRVFDKIKEMCRLGSNFVHEVYLEAGDLLVINNRKAIHGRTPFKPNFDGTDRWFQRLYIKEDLWFARTNSQKVSRVYDTV